MWDHPFFSAMACTRRMGLSALEAPRRELKKVCWGGGRQTPPFFSTHFFPKFFEIYVKIFFSTEFFFISVLDMLYGSNIFEIFFGRFQFVLID